MSRNKIAPESAPQELTKGEQGTEWSSERAELAKRIQCPVLASCFAQGDMPLTYDKVTDTLMCSFNDMKSLCDKVGIPHHLGQVLVGGNEKAFPKSAPAAERRKGMSDKEWDALLDNKDNKLIDVLRMSQYGLGHETDSGIRDNEKKQPDAEAMEKRMVRFMRDHDIKGQTSKVLFAEDFAQVVKLSKAAKPEVKGATTSGDMAGALGIFIECFGRVDEGDFWEKSYMTEEDLKRMYLESKYPRQWVPHTMAYVETAGEIVNARGYGASNCCAVS